MTIVHTYFYIVVNTQRGCHTLKLPTVVLRQDVDPLLHIKAVQIVLGMHTYLSFTSIMIGQI
jgi:hypothetical protein